MAQYCPRCGTEEADDQAAFCNRCGSRLPPPAPEETICPACGSAQADPAAVYCNRCGAPLHKAPKIPVVRRAGPGAAAARAAMAGHCPSCGAPRIGDTSAFCNICGKPFDGGPAPAAAPGSRYPPPAYQPAPAAAPPRAPAHPAAYHPAPAPAPARAGPLPPAPHDVPPEVPAAPAIPGATYHALEHAAQPPREPPAHVHRASAGGGPGEEEITREPGRRRFVKFALAAVVILAILAIAGAVLTGMIPFPGKATNASAGNGTLTFAATITTRPHTTAVTTAAPKTTATPIRTTTAPATTPAPTATRTPAANVTANATPAATRTPGLADSAKPIALGQAGYDGKGNLTVEDITWKDKMSDPIPSYAIGKKYLILNITYENLQANGTVQVPLTGFLLKDAGGYPFDPASDGMLGNPWTGTDIRGRETRKGNLLFIVPPEATYLQLHYTAASGNAAVYQIT